jgi:inhibitor of KinA
MTLSPLGDTAVVVELGSTIDESTVAKVRALSGALERDPPVGVVDVVAAFSSVTVFYDLNRIVSFDQFCAELKTRAGRALSAAQVAEVARVVEIPVCYGGEFGPDLAELAALSKLSPAEVVALHSGAEYRVHAIGFAPGFAYLAGLPAKLHTPRRSTPRTQVPAGTVGIGGAQTGVYPLVTPGGWNLIGRSPRPMFRPDHVRPSLLRSGDRVKFRPISPEEFATWK